MDGMLGKSVKDSVMLNVVFLAVDKAREKLKSRQGMIGRLIEISKFYELAVMQLDGCLRIVEMETNRFSMEVNHDEMLSDLYTVRDRLQRRLDDTELMVINTDCCLAERFKTERKLKEAVEMKEKEVNSLQGDLDQLERPKRKGHRKTQKSEANRVNNYKEADKSTLTNSLNPMFEERNFGAESSRIDELGSDIDKLKESMDVAFVKMQNAIFLSKVEPDECEWRWSIEKYVMLLAAKGLTEEFHNIHEPTVRKLNYMSPLMTDFRSLHTKLEQLMREKETYVHPSSSQTDSQVKVKERPPLDGKNGKNDERVGTESPVHSEEGGNYVAKLISTHERIIQKKIEEQRAKEKLIRERWYSAMRKDKQSDGLFKKIQEVIARLDSIINLNPEPENIPDALFEDNIKPMHLRRFSSESELDIRSFSSSMFCQVDEDAIRQVRMLEIEKEDLRLQSLIMEQVLTILLRDWMKQCYVDFHRRMKHLYIKVRILEQEAENSRTKIVMLENMCQKFEKGNAEVDRHVKTLERTNEDLEGQSSILEETYVVLLTTLTKELHEELQKMSASKDLLEEIVYEFTKML